MPRITLTKLMRKAARRNRKSQAQARQIKRDQEIRRLAKRQEQHPKKAHK